MDTLDKVDYVLNVIYNQWRINQPHLDWHLNKATTINPANNTFEAINPVEREEAIALLLADKYVRSVNTDGRTELQITIKGILFKEGVGGYKAQQRIKSNKRQIKKIERILLVSGTTTAGAYGVFEILKFFLLKRHVYLTIEYALAFFLFVAGILTGIAILLIVKEVLNRKK